MSETSITYNLLESMATGTYSVRNGFANAAEAKTYADSCTGRDDREFKIQRVVTVRSIDEIFTVRALPPLSIDDIAASMSNVYAESIDWQNEDYLALSESDKQKVRDMVEDATDSCENCGWTFEYHYLSRTHHGNICDHCETELAENEEEEEDDE